MLPHLSKNKAARLAGLEPATFGSVDRNSIQLSYRRKSKHMKCPTKILSKNPLLANLPVDYTYGLELFKANNCKVCRRDYSISKTFERLAMLTLNWPGSRTGLLSRPINSKSFRLSLNVIV